jgi:hypothetical protein
LGDLLKNFRELRGPGATGDEANSDESAAKPEAKTAA